jgi:hypothetical protein
MVDTENNEIFIILIYNISGIFRLEDTSEILENVSLLTWFTVSISPV